MPAKKEIILLLMVCVLPIHIRSILIFLYSLPAFLLSNSIWDILGIFSYVQVFSLIECVLIMAAFIFISVSLPRHIFRDKFIVQGTVIIFITSLWIIPLHYQTEILSSLKWNMRAYQFTAAIWVIGYLAVLVFFLALIRYKENYEHLIRKSIERVLPLSFLYILVDAVCFLLLAYRLIT